MLPYVMVYVLCGVKSLFVYGPLCVDAIETERTYFTTFSVNMLQHFIALTKTQYV